MSYTKQNFTDGQVLKAEHLNKMENELAREKSWNELADKPFGEVDGILVDGTLAFGSGQYTGIITNSPSAGDDVTIEFDGTTYVRKAVELDADTLATGNLSVLGAGDDTGEPFAIVFVPSAGMIMVQHTDVETLSHVVKVSCKIIAKIPTEYYDGADWFYGNDDYLYTDVDQTTKATKADVVKRGVKTPIIIIYGETHLLAVAINLDKEYAELFTLINGTSTMMFHTAEYTAE